jgi:hypothetical protein
MCFDDTASCSDNEVVSEAFAARVCNAGAVSPRRQVDIPKIIFRGLGCYLLLGHAFFFAVVPPRASVMPTADHSTEESFGESGSSCRLQRPRLSLSSPTGGN